MTFPFVGTHTADDWEGWGGQNYELVDDGVRLATAARRAYVDPTELLEDPSFAAVDVEVDDCGDVWFLAADATLYRLDTEADDLRRLHCTWDHPPTDPQALAVTEDTVYVASPAAGGAAEPSGHDDPLHSPDAGRVHAFSRRLMQTRWVARDLADPVALSRHGDRVSVLDRGADDPFVAVLGPGGERREPVTGFRAPRDLAVDDAGDRYVLDETAGGDPVVRRVREPGSEAEPGGSEGGDGESTDGGGDSSTHCDDGDPGDGDSSPTDGATAPTVEVGVPAEEFVTAGGEDVAPSTLSVGSPGDVVVGVDDVRDGVRSLFRYAPAEGVFERLPVYTGPVGGLLLRRDDAARAEGLYVLGDPGAATATPATPATGDHVPPVFLPATARTRLNPDTGRYDGQVVTRLDAGEDGTQWHRITADPDATAPGTQVRVSYYATDDPALSAFDPGTDPVPGLEYVHGIGDVLADRLRSAYVHGLGELVELSASRVASIASTPSYGVSETTAAGWIAEAERYLADRLGPEDADWQSVGPATQRDALLSDAEGRYLWVKVDLVGTAAATPSVDSLRAYFPRRSYLRYLPATYRSERGSADFLERYLSLFESVFTGVEEEISAATRYLDPSGAPGEALSWLGDWLSLSPDETWTTAEQRELLKAAPALFKRRGTPQGLRDLLRIYLEEPSLPAAWDWAHGKQRSATAARVAAGDLSAESGERRTAVLDRRLFLWEHDDLSCIDDPVVESLYEKLLPCPQCFAVLLWPFVDDAARREVQRVVDDTTPAHATGTAMALGAGLRLTGQQGDRGHATLLGVNSALEERAFELDDASLGVDSELVTGGRGGRYGSASRLGTDAHIS